MVKLVGQLRERLAESFFGYSALRLGGLWFSGVGRKVLVIVLAMRLASSGGGVVIFIYPSAFSSIREV